ncbi:MAG: site-specific DNA-methyltransferase [Anaerolineae bacterium]|jgi:site-specific DNA-methyltransferase (adenine-specific)|nr:site-specific DNA-methyltransferase [Anaerolineae bacterium]
MLVHNQIYCGDCVELIRDLPDESIDLVITSPPYYQQRDYGGGIGNETTLDQYLDRLITLIEACIRVTKPDGSIVFNLGDKYAASSLLLVPYRFAIRATEQFPTLRLVNAITWVKRNPTPRQFKRRLVSSTEPFFHFVKTDDYYYAIDQFLAIQDQRPLKSESKVGQNLGKRYFELIANSDLTDEQKQLARTELQKVILEAQAGQIAGFRMKIRGLHAEPFGGQAGGRQIQLAKNGFTIIRIYGNPLKRDVIETPVETFKGSQHPAVYPVKLVIEFLHLLTRPGGLVLDPFMGSGSTAVACKLTGRDYLGFELNPDYCQFAEQRLKSMTTQPNLL